ncbi:hypothetical protein C8R45DRAFT_1078871 [Mycena sanguinolenta]|nr:hypothetical protein C8R45DRAFT_1078871 [Mycena sanguinolenta]
MTRPRIEQVLRGTFLALIENERTSSADGLFIPFHACGAPYDWALSSICARGGEYWVSIIGTGINYSTENSNETSRAKQGEKQTHNEENGVDNGASSEHIELIFRNHGGMPTFHFGGADVGVASSDAWDYTRVINTGIAGRTAKVAGDKGVDLRVKVEDDSLTLESRRGRSGSAMGWKNRLRVLGKRLRARGMCELARAVDPTRLVARALSVEEEE